MVLSPPLSAAGHWESNCWQRFGFEMSLGHCEALRRQGRNAAVLEAGEVCSGDRSTRRTGMKCGGKIARAMHVPIPTLVLVRGPPRETQSVAAEVEVPGDCPTGQLCPLALGDQHAGLVGWKRRIHC